MKPFHTDRAPLIPISLEHQNRGFALAILRGTTVNRTYDTHKNLPGIYVPIFTDNIWSYLIWLTAVNRTYGTHKNLSTCLFLPTNIGPYYYGPA